MLDMRLDHLSYAAGPDGLASTAQRIGGLLGRDFIDGGVHPRFGTRNMIMPLADGTYIEIVEVLDHPASDKAPFGQAVRARSVAVGSAGSSRSTTSPRSRSAWVARPPSAAGTVPTGPSCAGSRSASTG